jgi:dolichol-phosphate mannosyltransferase
MADSPDNDRLDLHGHFRTYRAALRKGLGRTSSPEATAKRPEVSVVVPVYWNAPSLRDLYDRIAKTMAAAEVDGWEAVFVDDASGDDSRDVLHELAQRFDNVCVLHLSKNFGSFAGTTAGLAYATGSCVAVISADLQDPPELLQEMIGKWRNGTKVVIATRDSRDDPSLFSTLFYWTFRKLVSPTMPKGGFDFYVIDAQVAHLLSDHAEKNTTSFAALLWLGFPREVVKYHRAKRAHGTSRWRFWGKFKLAFDSILSYSYAPIRAITVAGAVAMLFSAIYAGVVIYHRLTTAEPVPGYASLLVVTVFFDGIILMSLGVLGEYLWRAFDAARPRPYYVVNRWALSADLAPKRAPAPSATSPSPAGALTAITTSSKPTEAGASPTISTS